jgi:hypothetical protein
LFILSKASVSGSSIGNIEPVNIIGFLNHLIA